MYSCYASQTQYKNIFLVHRNKSFERCGQLHAQSFFARFVWKHNQLRSHIYKLWYLLPEVQKVNVRWCHHPPTMIPVAFRHSQRHCTVDLFPALYHGCTIWVSKCSLVCLDWFLFAAIHLSSGWNTCWTIPQQSAAPADQSNFWRLDTSRTNVKTSSRMALSVRLPWTMPLLFSWKKSGFLRRTDRVARHPLFGQPGLTDWPLLGQLSEIWPRLNLVGLKKVMPSSQLV